MCQLKICIQDLCWTITITSIIEEPFIVGYCTFQHVLIMSVCVVLPFINWPDVLSSDMHGWQEVLYCVHTVHNLLPSSKHNHGNSVNHWSQNCGQPCTRSLAAIHCTCIICRFIHRNNVLYRTEMLLQSNCTCF